MENRDLRVDVDSSRFSCTGRTRKNRPWATVRAQPRPCDVCERRSADLSHGLELVRVVSVQIIYAVQIMIVQHFLHMEAGVLPRSFRESGAAVHICDQKYISDMPVATS